MNKSKSSEPKRANKQPNRAGGRSGAATETARGEKTSAPPVEAKPSLKRKAVEGQGTARKNKPVSAKSAPRLGAAKNVVKAPKERKMPDVKPRHRNDERSQVNEKEMKGSKTKAKHFT